ncbi:hypothetical protein ACROYT_G019270 [Oculina patagonica]
MEDSFIDAAWPTQQDSIDGSADVSTVQEGRTEQSFMRKKGSGASARHYWWWCLDGGGDLNRQLTIILNVISFLRGQTIEMTMENSFREEGVQIKEEQQDEESEQESEKEEHEQKMKKEMYSINP